MKFPRTLLAPLAVIALAACTAEHAPGSVDRSADGSMPGAALPTPAVAEGDSITGMPDAPPDGSPVPLDAAASPVPIDEGAPPADAIAETEIPTDTPAPPMPATEPGTDAAVQVIRDYYAAINRRDYATAYRLWRGGGNASGQSLAQFTRGFQDTSGVSLQIGAPGRIDAGAGQRHVEVPISLVARHHDGRESRFRGSYVLQRTVVDGATLDQREWRIASARLGEVQ